MKIIVLSITPYKEKDGIIDAISEKGDISFLAKGIFDPKNKNSALNNNLIIADIELNEGNYKYSILKSAKIIANPMKLDSDFYYLSCLLLIAEATKQLLQDEEKIEIFDSLTEAVTALKTAKEPWVITLIYMAKLLKITGYDFEVNQCVFCGSKNNIVSFSFNDGGFVCQNCANEETERDLSKTQMLLIRSAFNATQYPNKDVTCDKIEFLAIINKFNEFIYDSFGVKLKSISLLNK